MTNIVYAWALEFTDRPADGLEWRFWSGAGTLTINESDGTTSTYTGMNGAIGLVPPKEEAGEGVRLTAQLDAHDNEIRKQMVRDLGPLRVKIRWLVRNNSDATPTYKPFKTFQGRLSKPVLKGSLYSIDVESMISDINRGRTVYWSHDTQTARHSDDLGFEFLTSLAEGIQTKWPP